jgi:hypothetical protein
MITSDQRSLMITVNCANSFYHNHCHLITGVGEWIRHTEIRIGEKILRTQKFKSVFFFFQKVNLVSGEAIT